MPGNDASVLIEANRLPFGVPAETVSAGFRDLVPADSG